MTLPQSNALLTLIKQPGGTEDYDQDGTDGVTRWAGALRVYLLVKSERVSTGTDSSVIETRRIVVPATFSDNVKQGDHLTVTPDIGEAATVTAQSIRVAQMPGVQGTILIELEDQ